MLYTKIKKDISSDLNLKKCPHLLYSAIYSCKSNLSVEPIILHIKLQICCDKRIFYVLFRNAGTEKFSKIKTFQDFCEIANALRLLKV